MAELKFLGIVLRWSVQMHTPEITSAGNEGHTVIYEFSLYGIIGIVEIDNDMACAGAMRDFG